MKLFTAALVTETNTFSPIPAGYEAFEQYGIFRGDGSTNPDKSLFGPLLALWRGLAEGQGYEVSESLCIFAQPGGRTPARVYEEFRDTILEDLEASLPVNVVVLSLHGAMAAEGYDDCEGDLLQKVRETVGADCTVGALVDPHCHLTEAMVENAEILIAYKEFPHSDIGERGGELFALCHQAHMGLIRPIMKAYDCNMIGMWRTPYSPVREFVDSLQAMEKREKVLSVSFGHGFPYADVEQVGAKTWAVADGDEALAAETAKEAGEAAIAIRQAGINRCLPLEQIGNAIGEAPDGLVVVAEPADNPGGGAASDATFVLEHFIREGITNAVFGLFWDPGAIEICRNAGPGARLPLRIGGKCGPRSGKPVDVDAVIRRIEDNHAQPGLAGSTSAVGTAVWIEFDGIDLVLTSIRSQPFAPEVFTGLGIDLAERRVVVVKSIEHFSAGFGPISSKILYVDSPGALAQDFLRIPYTRRDPDFWPRTDQPAGRPFP